MQFTNLEHSNEAVMSKLVITLLYSALFKKYTIPMAFNESYTGNFEPLYCTIRPVTGD